MNKNETWKMDGEKQREGKGWECRGEKQSVLARISQGFLPMWFPHTDSSSSLSLLGPSFLLMFREDHTNTKWFHDLILDGGGEDESWVSGSSFHSWDWYKPLWWLGWGGGGASGEGVEATVCLGKCWTGWVKAGVFNPKNLSPFKYN